MCKVVPYCLHTRPLVDTTWVLPSISVLGGGPHGTHWYASQRSSWPIEMIRYNSCLSRAVCQRHAINGPCQPGGYKWHYYTVTLRILWSDCNAPGIGCQWMHLLKPDLETHYSELNETLQSQGLTLLCQFSFKIVVRWHYICNMASKYK